MNYYKFKNKCVFNDHGEQVFTYKDKLTLSLPCRKNINYIFDVDTKEVWTMLNTFEGGQLTKQENDRIVGDINDLVLITEKEALDFVIKNKKQTITSLLNNSVK